MKKSWRLKTLLRTTCSYLVLLWSVLNIFVTKLTTCSILFQQHSHCIEKCAIEFSWTKIRCFWQCQIEFSSKVVETIGPSVSSLVTHILFDLQHLSLEIESTLFVYVFISFHLVPIHKNTWTESLHEGCLGFPMLETNTLDRWSNVTHQCVFPSISFVRSGARRSRRTTKKSLSWLSPARRFLFPLIGSKGLVNHWKLKILGSSNRTTLFEANHESRRTGCRQIRFDNIFATFVSRARHNANAESWAPNHPRFCPPQSSVERRKINGVRHFPRWRMALFLSPPRARLPRVIKRVERRNLPLT